MLQLARRLFLIVLATVAGAGTALAQQPVKQVYLIQNSGWMDAFYNNPASGFRQAVEWAISNTAGASPIFVGTFNQDGQVPGEKSPQELYSGAFSPPAISSAVAKLGVAKKSSGAWGRHRL